MTIRDRGDGAKVFFHPYMLESSHVRSIEQSSQMPHPGFVYHTVTRQLALCPANNQVAGDADRVVRSRVSGRVRCCAILIRVRHSEPVEIVVSPSATERATFAVIRAEAAYTNCGGYIRGVAPPVIEETFDEPFRRISDTKTPRHH